MLLPTQPDRTGSLVYTGHQAQCDHVETRDPGIAHCQSSDEDIIAGLYESYTGPHFYCWSGSRAQLKVNRSGLTRDDQAGAGAAASPGRSESLTGLGSVQWRVRLGWSPVMPVWTNQRPDTRVTGQSEAASIPRGARIRRGVQAWTSANICSKYLYFSTEFYEIS